PAQPRRACPPLGARMARAAHSSARDANKGRRTCQPARGRLAAPATPSRRQEPTTLTPDPIPAPPATASPDATLAVWRTRALELERAVGRVVVGQSRAIRLLTIAVLARGDVLLEGNVGVGKTVLLRRVARAIA